MIQETILWVHDRNRFGAGKMGEIIGRVPLFRVVSGMYPVVRGTSFVQDYLCTFSAGVEQGVPWD